MSNEARKQEIKRRLNRAKYPVRAAAVFSDENDHNPLVLERCSRCSGRGQVDIYQRHNDAETWSLEVCPLCSGEGTTEEIVPFFENQSPAIDVEANNENWVKCPLCGWKFSVQDSSVWTGRRHKRCGQKLNVIKT